MHVTQDLSKTQTKFKLIYNVKKSGFKVWNLIKIRFFDRKLHFKGNRIP